MSAAPDNGVAHYNLGVLHQSQSRFEQAEKAFSRAIQINPDFVRAYTNRGVLKLQQKRHQEALRDFSQAVNRSAPSAESYFNRGVALEAMARYGDAASDYSKAIAVDPTFAPAFFNRGSLRICLDREELGERDLETACSLGLCSRHGDDELPKGQLEPFKPSRFEGSARHRLQHFQQTPLQQSRFSE